LTFLFSKITAWDDVPDHLILKNLYGLIEMPLSKGKGILFFLFIVFGLLFPFSGIEQAPAAITLIDKETNALSGEATSFSINTPIYPQDKRNNGRR
jgi:hypothetical protein